MSRQLASALDSRTAPLELFFRDDDAGWAMPALDALLDLFTSLDCPVDLAVIPAAIDHSAAEQLNQRRTANPRIGLHQHGYAHSNHEAAPNRKCEFGPARPLDRQCADIIIGRDRMADLLGETDPIFTPPWNRYDPRLPSRLSGLGFAMLSDDHGGQDEPGLTMRPVTVDWERTRATADPAETLAPIVAHADAPVGIMLHHATLDDRARERLGATIALLSHHDKVHLRSMRHWLGGHA